MVKLTQRRRPTGSQDPPWEPANPRLPPRYLAVPGDNRPGSEAEPRGGYVPGQTLGRRHGTLTPALSRRERGRRRRGSATIDYFLIIAIVLPLAAFILRIAPRAIQSVYDLLTVVVAWPFM